MQKPFQNLGTIIQKDGTIKPVVLKQRPLGSAPEERSKAPKKEITKSPYIFMLILALMFLVHPAFAAVHINPNIFEIRGLNKNEALNQQTLRDYHLIYDLYGALEGHRYTQSIKLVIVPFKQRFVLEATGGTQAGLAEGYLLSDGTILLHAYPRRGQICHELLHAFAHDIQNPVTKEEFFVACTQYLIDGRTPGTEFLVTSEIKKSEK